MTKVLHIVLGLQVGGLEKFVLDLITNYQSDFKTFIVCLEGKGDLGQQTNIEIIELAKGPGFSLKVIRQLVALTTDLKIDIIHTHNPGPHIYGTIAGFLTRRPVIHTKHGRNFPNDKKKVWLNRIFAFLTNRIVAVSLDAADVCRKVEMIPFSKLIVILNGVDTNIFCPIRTDYEVMRLPVHIGIVARLSWEKDHSTLLNACELLVTQTANFHLEIIGDGPLRGELEKAANTLGLDKYVSFTGMRHDIPDLLRNLDIFVLSSTTEGISLTLLEAMATELPVVATNVGGNPEVVIDGETGYIVSPQNPEEMACKLMHLINDKNLRREMGIKGRARVLANFSIKETSRKYQELYCAVLNKG